MHDWNVICYIASNTWRNMRGEVTLPAKTGRHITTIQVHKWQWQAKATRYRTVAAEERRRYNNVIAINNYNRDSNDGYEHNENMRTGIQ